MTSRIELVDGILWVTLDRPRALNAIDEQVLGLLEEATATAEHDDAVRGLVIEGGGDRAFSVGLDLDLLDRAFGDLAYFRSVLERLGAVLDHLEVLPVPVVASVDGIARAGGFELLLACDLVVVSERARIGDGHFDVNVIPGGGATQRAPRRLGQQLAREMLLLGRWLDADDAVDCGLALRAVPSEDLRATVTELLDPTRRRSRDATRRVKRLLRDGAHLSVGEAAALEVDRFIDFLATSEDPHTGFRRSRDRVRGS